MDNKFNPPMQWGAGEHATSATKEPQVTLLDHFAGLAMQAMLSSDFQMEKLKGDSQQNDRTLSVTCYRVAKAMLKVREESLKKLELTNE